MNNKWQFWLIGTLLSINLGIFWYLASQLQANGISIHFLSVGQGDAHLIQTRHANILIDAGPSIRTANELDKIMPIGNRVVDIALISHPNVDHFYGLLEIMKRYQVRLVMVTGAMTDDAKYQLLLTELQNKNIPVLYSRQGQEIIWDKARLQVLWPDFGFGFGQVLPEAKLNDSSLVALVSYGDFETLFTGDISANIEKKLVSLVPEIEVLKVAHHGSKYSTVDYFLEKLVPEIALIPVGENRYGHPSNEALNRLRAYTQNIFDTLSRGTVTIISDGQEYLVLSER
jgi:competence protein ComEC